MQAVSFALISIIAPRPVPLVAGSDLLSLRQSFNERGAFESGVAAKLMG